MRSGVLVLTAALGLLTHIAGAAPIGYLFDGDNGNGYKVDLANGATNQFAVQNLGFDIAIVGDKLRLGGANDGQGAEYDLNGVATGVTFTGGGNFTSIIDGTTNGINNFGISADPFNGGVVIADLYWQGATKLFTLPDGGRGFGITYDSSTNTLWVLSGAGFGSLLQYSMQGTLLNTILLANGTGGLAYDASTDTLWMAKHSTTQIYNYSKTGLLLGTTNSVQSLGTSSGFEIYNGQVPEPASLILAALGLAACAGARRFRKQ